MVRGSLAAIAFALAASAAAHAAPTRAWVSGHGVDETGCGAPAAPCRSLQYAHDNAVGAGGEIDILDPAGYGAITITKAISIVNDGVGTAGVQATSGNAITITAGSSDGIVLRGLSIDGVNGSGGTGVLINSAGSLLVTNCVVAHFQSNGIQLALAAGALKATISNTTVTGNGSGFFMNAIGSASYHAVFDHVTSVNNIGNGIAVYAASTATASALIENSVVSGDGMFGVIFNQQDKSTISGLVDDTYLTDNTNGLAAFGTPVVRLNRSSIFANVNGASNSSVSIISSGNNLIRGNTTSNAGTLSVELLQ